MKEEKLNILILEDNPDDAELIVRELEKAGFVFEWKRVETEKAFKKTLSEKPDIILTDYKLPSFNGMAAIKLQQKIAPDIPLILISGTIGEELAVNCLKAGATDYVLKDRLSRLGTVVKHALKEYNERRELRQTQQALQESEKKYRDLVENIEEGIASVDENEKFIYVNPAVTKIFGYSEKELLNKSLKDLTTPEEFQKITKQTSIRKTGKTSKYELNIITKDGNNAIISITPSPLFDDNKRYIGAYGIINDITECKKAEEDIRRSAVYIRSLIEASLDPLVTIDPDGKITDVNEATENVTGRKRKELIGSDFSDYFTEPAKAKKGHKQVFIKGIVINYPLEIKHKNGSITSVLYNASVYKDESGNVIGIFAAARDITEPKKVEMEIRLLQKLTMAISEATDFETALYTALSLTCEHTGWVMGEAWVPNHNETALEYYLGWCDDSNEHNKRLSRFIQLSKQFKFPLGVGLPGRVWLSMRPEWQNDVASLSEEIYLRAKPSKEAGLKAALGVPIISNGQVLTVLVFYMTTPKPEDVHQIKIVSAVAAQLGTVILRKRAEEKLKESEEKYRQLAETAKDVIMVLDLKGNVKYINQEGIDLCGYSKEEISKMNVNDVLSEDNIPLSDNNFAKRIAGDKGLFMYEIDFFNNKGDKIPVEVKSSLITEQGKPSGVLIIARDITERKKAEEDLKQALAKATESDRLKSAFLNAMSHELRTPLNAVIGFSEIIDKDTSIDEILDYSKTIKYSGNHLLKIVEDIFDITMIESGEVEIQKEEFNIITFMDDIHEKLKTEQELTEKQNIDIYFNPAEKAKDFLVYTDRSHLKRILINILKNALKFTNEGKIEYGYIKETQQEEPVLKFYVKDTGIGIPEYKLEIIFDIFRQADDTDTRLYGGTGIGLSVSKKLTELLGGKIWLDTEEGICSTFYFTLPYRKPETFKK